MNSVYSKSSKKFKTTTNSTHNHLIVPNVLNRKFSVAEPSKVWVSNVTYPSKRRVLYLTTVLDGYDRKIIGWSLSNGISKGDSLAALRMAVKNRNIEKV
jgi:transposase InsO family protein